MNLFSCYLIFNQVFIVSSLQAYSQNPLRTSTKPFQGEDTARWSGGHVIVRATSKERGRAAGNSIVED